MTRGLIANELNVSGTAIEARPADLGVALRLEASARALKRRSAMAMPRSWCRWSSSGARSSFWSAGGSTASAPTPLCFWGAVESYSACCGSCALRRRGRSGTQDKVAPAEAVGWPRYRISRVRGARRLPRAPRGLRSTVIRGDAICCVAAPRRLRRTQSGGGRLSSGAAIRQRLLSADAKRLQDTLRNSQLPPAYPAIFQPPASLV
jgi:hypothetical protein